MGNRQIFCGLVCNLNQCHISATRPPSKRRIVLEYLKLDVSAIWYEQMTEVSKSSSKETAENALDENALNAIRSILTEETKPAPRRTSIREAMQPAAPSRAEAPLRSKARMLPEIESPDAAPEMQSTPPKTARWKNPLARKSKATKPEPMRAPRPDTKRADAGIADKIKAYRPTPAHVALAAFVLLVVLRPWLVLGLTFLSLFIIVGVFLIAGYDGFWQGVIKFGRWYANRRPERAAVLHARLDRFAVAWDSVLDRFPEGTVDGLYLPDFGDMATAEDRHAQAMERRLSNLQGKGA